MAEFSFDDLVKKADLNQSLDNTVPKLSKAEAVQKLKEFPIHYFFTASSESKEKGSYDFAFDLKKGTYHAADWIHGMKKEKEGKLSSDAIDALADDLWFILNLPKDQYITNTKSQYLTTDAYERETYGPIMTRSRCELHVGPYFFRWIAKVDTESPFNQLYKAMHTLLQSIENL